MRVYIKLLALGLIAVAAFGSAPSFAARKPVAGKYSVIVAYFTATPKPLRPGQVRRDFTGLFPKDGANFTVDVTTPVRFRRQMESISRDYDYSLELIGTQACETGVQTPFGILPDKNDPTRKQMTGVVTATYSTTNVVNLSLTSVSVFVNRPGEKKPVPVFKLEYKAPVVLGRTYLAGAAPSAKGKDVPIHMMVVSVVPG